MSKNYSIIYNTCDKYESLWPRFFVLFKKYWPECDKKIILNTEEKSFQIKGLNISRPLFQNKNCSWSQRLINSLNSIDTPFVVIILDDFFLKDYVRNDVFEDCLDRMQKDSSIKSITFAWQPGPNRKDVADSLFERRGRFTKYRVNAQIALWRVDYLKKILRSYENPWQFELSGSFRSSIYGGTMLALKKDAPLVFDYDFGFLIIRGKINERIANYFINQEGLDMDLPFEVYTEEKLEKDSHGRNRRIAKYIIDMLISLFRK